MHFFNTRLFRIIGAKFFQCHLKLDCQWEANIAYIAAAVIFCQCPKGLVTSAVVKILEWLVINMKAIVVHQSIQIYCSKRVWHYINFERLKSVLRSTAQCANTLVFCLCMMWSRYFQINGYEKVLPCPWYILTIFESFQMRYILHPSSISDAPWNKTLYTASFESSWIW